jgi:hypothetical protein
MLGTSILCSFDLCLKFELFESNIMKKNIVIVIEVCYPEAHL